MQAADRSMDHLYPPFAAKYAQVLKDLQVYLDKRHLGLTCKMIQGYRSAEYQHELYQKGRTTPGPGAFKDNPLGSKVTNADGHRSLSNHQSACAADVGIFARGGQDYIEEPPKDVNEYYGHLLRAENLEWGGDWRSIKDEPHGQIPATDHATYGAARTWLSQQPWA